MGDDLLYFFAEHDDQQEEYTIRLQVISDGDIFPAGGMYLCAVPKVQAGHVWILVGLPSPDRELEPFVVEVFRRPRRSPPGEWARAKRTETREKP